VAEARGCWRIGRGWREAKNVNHTINRELFQQCEAVFLDEIVKTIRIIAGRTSLNEAEKEKLASALAFGVAAHLSGSSYGGSVTGNEIHPVLGFMLGGSGDKVYFGGASRFHELVPKALEPR
jgi:hypothetical protein